MPDSNFIIAIAAFAFVFAGFVKGVLGQGLPTVAVGILALVMSPGEATALLIFPALITNIWQAWFGPSLGMLLRRLWPVIAAICFGTWLGTVLGLGLLTPETASLARKTLGAALILYGLLGLSRVRMAVPPRFQWWLGPLMGTVNGMVSVATGVFMVPVIPYIQSLGFERDDMGQAQGISFTTSTAALSIVLITNGTMNVTNATGSLIAVPVTFMGMFLGQYVRSFVHPEVFRILFFLLMLEIGRAHV